VTPLVGLLSEVRQGSTGEFIAAGGGLEVHVYLQAGRIAWGTTSTERFVFQRTLTERFGVSKEMLAATVAEGAKTGKPLGESLVGEGRLSLEQVRVALWAQVSATLTSLANALEARWVFLPRGERFNDYDARLTFTLEEVTSALKGEGAGARVT
jgi:hypothetical protein